MSTEERSIEDTLGRRCEVCNTALTDEEIAVAREAGGPFLCSVHAAEELPVEPDPGVEDATEGSQPA